MKKKILLIPGHKMTEPYLGLLSVATILEKAGHKPLVLDLTFISQKSSRALVNYLKTYIADTLMVGISAMTPYVRKGLDIAKALRKLNPSLPIVWGGAHTTFFPRETLNSNFVDYVVIGDGEYTCLELAQALASRSKNLSDINGLGLYKCPSRIYQS